MTPEDRMLQFFLRSPSIDKSAYIASGAIINGDVTIGPQSSIWHNCVLRADINSIKIGRASNIQDGSVLHLSDEYGVVIGDYVTVGHIAMIHACTIGDECLIGMHATILDGAEIGAQSLIGAHSLVTQNTKIPPGSLVLGAPAKVIRPLTPTEIIGLRQSAEKYAKLAAAHKQRYSNKT